MSPEIKTLKNPKTRVDRIIPIGPAGGKSVRAVTLIELIIAMTLLSVIVIAAGTFEISSNQFLRSSERKTAVLNDLALVLDYLHRDISQATGDYGVAGAVPINFGIVGPPIELSLIIRVDQGTPNIYTDDVTINYMFSPGTTGGTIQRNGVVLTDRLAGPTMSSNVPNEMFDFAGGVVTARNITLRFDPSLDPDNSTNPTVSVSGISFMPMMASSSL